jgi:hypothetical protein
MKTKIYQNNYGVTVEYHDPITDEFSKTCYFTNGNYVMINKINNISQGNYPQACYCLAETGSTMQSTQETLLADIRREHKKRHYNNKKLFLGNAWNMSA